MENDNLNARMLMLKALRARAESLNGTVASDIKAFLHEEDRVTFRKHPVTLSKHGEYSVATTCTSLSALIINDALGDVYGNDATEQNKHIDSVINYIMDDPWDSSGLPADNTFTAVIVLRAISKLLKKKYIDLDYVLNIRKGNKGTKFKNKYLKNIADRIISELPNSLKVGNNHPNPAIGYWFLDAITELQLDLPVKKLAKLSEWGRKEFYRQISYVSANNYANVDPVTLAMASCTLLRIRRNALVAPDYQDLLDEDFPSSADLENGVLKFFDYQRSSGIWDKYFPLFHYPDAGASYCWSFEVLEAILTEFGEIIDNADVLQAIQKTLSWCETYRLNYPVKDIAYCGWNSGGQQKTLAVGMPESWSTAIVHMFLVRLGEAISGGIQRQALEKFGVTRVRTGIQDPILWDKLLDSKIKVYERHGSLKELLKKSFINPVLTGKNQESSLEYRSAVLFGPPGTAKTSIVKAIASYIDWPLIEITPSSFLDKGYINIFGRTNEMFDDLLELSNVVILFDEIDGLLQERDRSNDEKPVDANWLFLTTSMLPKLTKLHDHGQVLFFVCTNHRENFDTAVKRAGRFDMLLFVPPPSWEVKLSKLELFLPKRIRTDCGDLKSKIESWIGEDTDTKEILDLATFDELKAFFRELQSLDVGKIGQELFNSKLKLWKNKSYFSLFDERAKEEFLKDHESSRIQ